ncbi:hypothetical protein PRIPAC_80304 [Pristionchus pacificus]|uniref:Uncharacterized protein n=1 Tax=Pristionchus pacificus TaxID=54126 RepID=A0A2A6C1Z5_PRIPA|nr:hypothetical protein PRIPAC_80304 [Pristionchus pacificus]|eukprot:PDM72127.1 hypothetical protein PRIPAC_38561 [Pristionchus pacificus]
MAVKRVRAMMWKEKLPSDGNGRRFLNEVNTYRGGNGNLDALQRSIQNMDMSLYMTFDEYSSDLREKKDALEKDHESHLDHKGKIPDKPTIKKEIQWIKKQFSFAKDMYETERKKLSIGDESL